MITFVHSLAAVLPVLGDETTTPMRLTLQSRIDFGGLSVPTILLAPVFLLAIVAVVYLYRAQRRLTSRWTVVALTVLRALLLLLVLVLLLQPALAWTRSVSSAGNLYLLLDHSPSMATTDPQATDIEKFRWADALGFLPAGLRPGRPDVALARLECLRIRFNQLKPVGAAGLSDPKLVAGMAQDLRAWLGRLRVVEKEVAKDAQLQNAEGKAVAAAIRAIGDTLEAQVGRAQGRGTLADAVAEIDWIGTQRALESSVRDLFVAADRADGEFLRAHGTDEDITSALARVSGLKRSELALLALTNRNQARTGHSLADLLPRYHTKILAFADTTESLPAGDAGQLRESLENALSPEGAGKATDISSPLQRINEQVGGNEAASVIVVSDGRHNVPGDPTDPARLLATRSAPGPEGGGGVRVYTLTVGSQQLAPDASVDQIDAPDWIYKDDAVKAAALVRLEGLPGQRVKVEFLRGDTVLDTQTLRAAGNQDTQTVQFSDKPPEARAYEYEVRVSNVPGELNTQNNRQRFQVAVKKDKLTALYIEDQPRWEYQFLANYLDRDSRLKLQTILLSPAEIADVAPPPDTRPSPKNPRREATVLPATQAEWQAFDLILIGDVGPDKLPAAAQQFIAQAVRDRGTTLILLAGPNAMPARYAPSPPLPLVSPLGDLLPVQNAGDWTPEQLQRHLTGGFAPILAPEGATTVLGSLSLDPEANSRLWAKLPAWYWHSPYTQAKPSASVLWAIGEPNGFGVRGGGEAGTLATLRKRALVATMPVGLGRSLYLASDQTWRLRYVQGENLQDRFWGQVISWAVGSDLPAGGRFVRFGANRPRYVAGEAVTVTIRVLREDLTPYTGLSFDATARTPSSPPSSSPRDPKNTAEGRLVSTATVREMPEAPGYYRAIFSDLPAGTLDLSLAGREVERLLADDPSVTSKSLRITVTPRLDVEQRNVNTNAPLMARLAQSGGGIALLAPYADVLAEELPQLKQVHHESVQLGMFTDPKNPLTQWSHWLYLAAFAVVITAEWAVRKRAGLV